MVALYQHALPVIYRYALARLGRPDMVEDVVSEVFLVMVESIDELRSEQEAGFYAWLLQIAQGKISRALRQVTRAERKQIPLPGTQTSHQHNSLELVATDLVSNPVELHEWRETLDELGIAMSRLSAEQQVIVIGRFLAGQKIDDLAQALGKRPGAVRILQFRALNTLAKHLGLARGSHRKQKGERV
jgi:RNA polymerase sigma-70 factor (ECF subfamily)